MSVWPNIYAQLDDWAPMRYRFKGASHPWDEVAGLSLRIPDGERHVNCCVYVWASILRALEVGGQPHAYSSALQKQAMVIDPAKHRAGPVDAVISMGLGTPIRAEDYQPGVGPCVAQFWRKKGAASGGHSLFLVGCGSDEDTEEGVWTLEANGRSDGSGPARGLDGVGCRVKAGDGTWRAQKGLPPLEVLYTWDELRAEYGEIYLARLS